MMTGKSLFFGCFLSLLTLVSFSMAPPVREWQRTLGGSATDNGTRIIRDGGAGFWILGNTNSFNGTVNILYGATDVYLVHTDQSGNIQSAFSFGGSGIENANDIELLSNGQLLITGYTNSTSFAGTPLGGYDGYLLCIDSAGTIQWSRRFGGANPDLAYDITVTPNGYVVTGGTYSSFPGNGNNGDQDVWITRFDLNGNLLWEKNFGGSSLDIGYGSIFVNNGEILAAGLTLSNNIDVSNNHGGLDAWLLKVSEVDGTLLWQQCYGGTGNDAAFNIKNLSNGSIAFSGYSRSSNGDLTSNYGFNDGWIAIIDITGSILNQRSIGGTGADVIYTMEEAADGFILGCSSTSSDMDVTNNMGMEDVWMVKLDTQLNTVWSRSFGGADNDRPASLIDGGNNSITVCGYSLSNNGDVNGNYGASDMWLFHVACLAPAMSITGNTSMTCAGDTVTLVNRSSNFSTKQWYLDNSLIAAGDTLHLNITIAGNYTVSLSGKTCENSDSTAYPFTLSNCAAPLADFTSDVVSVCEGGTVHFTDQSVMATMYDWEFPGGSPALSSDPNPVVTYAAPGTYEVILTARNQYGNSTLTRTSYITVNPAPVAPTIQVSGDDLYCPTSLVIEWYWNNLFIATDPLLFNVADGYYHAIIFDANGCSASTDTILIRNTSLSQMESEAISMFPNPAYESVMIKTNCLSKAEFHDGLGRKVLSADLREGIQPISLTSLPPGVYYVIISTENKTFYHRLIRN